jgi:anthranilate synthase component I
MPAATERASLRREVVAALRGPVPRMRRGGSWSPPVAALTPRCSTWPACARAGVHRRRRCLPAGAVIALLGRHDLDPFQVYRALRLINPSPYMFYCRLGELTVVGSSPEALVKLSMGQAELRPIAGTRPRADDPALDARREAELRADPKENAEHVMLVDLARNDLGRVARAGSVRVEPYRSIERYSHVMHMVSGVQGVLARRARCLRPVRGDISGRHAGRRA